jgi:hypothetical protein
MSRMEFVGVSTIQYPYFPARRSKSASKTSMVEMKERSWKGRKILN